jgi:hypothetical protein
VDLLGETHPTCHWCQYNRQHKLLIGEITYDG